MARAIWRIQGGGIDLDECTATPDKVLAPYTFGGAGSDEIQAGTIPSKETTAIMPGKNNIVIPGGQYLAGDQTVFGDSGLVPGNIRKGAIIFGVAGTYEGYYTGPLDIYNRGSWGSGYGSNFIKAAGFSDAYPQVSAVTIQRSAIKVEGGYRSSCVSTKLVDFTPYKSINVVLSSYSVLEAYFKVRDKLFILAWPVGNGKTVCSDIDSVEKTLTIDISKITTYCGFSICLSGRSDPYYIHKIYFTV